MKRQMTGGTHRGPLGLRRQRRTVRFTQFLLVAIAAGLLLFAGYSWGRSSGYSAGRSADEIDAPAEPSSVQTIVLTLLGAGSLGAALLLQGGPESVRIPTPARLDELAGRAESAAVDRAGQAASQTKE
ncbi:MAG: hypothetical protein ACRDJ2_13325 [Actinomycetota bacterium]